MNQHPTLENHRWTHITIVLNGCIK